jgi:hypothetical protein
MKVKGIESGYLWLITILIGVVLLLWVIEGAEVPSSAQIAAGCARHSGVASAADSSPLGGLIITCKDGKVWQSP